MSKPSHTNAGPQGEPVQIAQQQRLTGRLGDVVAKLLATPLASGLYIVATPIGNLADISLRALSVLARADVVLCEDTRHSRVLLDHYGLRAKLHAYHEHNAARERPRVLSWLAEGRSVALISDAGTPLICDPGFKLVRDVARAGSAVYAVPGPTAFVAAASISGLPSDKLLFAGFLPAKQGARRARLEELAMSPATIVVYEAPTRLLDALSDISELMPNREIAIARELTKLHEEIMRGSPGDLLARLADQPVRGEIVILLGPPQEQMVSDDVIKMHLREAMKRMSPRDAIREVAELLKIHRKRVYTLAVSGREAEAEACDAPDETK